MPIAAEVWPSPAFNACPTPQTGWNDTGTHGKGRRRNCLSRYGICEGTRWHQ